MPESRSAPVKVVVFQCPCGIAALQRRPFTARPYSRAILVEAPGSSIRPGRWGSFSGWAGPQAGGGGGRSGLVCSGRWAVFFNRHAMAVEEAPQRRGRKTLAVLLAE